PRGAENGPEARRRGSFLLRIMIVVIHILPTGLLAGLPGEQFHLLVCPGAVVVFLLFQSVIFVKWQQDEGFLGTGIYKMQWRGVSAVQGLQLLFGQFDHESLLSSMVCRAATLNNGLFVEEGHSFPLQPTRDWTPKGTMCNPQPCTPDGTLACAP